jgi:hypothetical protein
LILAARITLAHFSVSSAMNRESITTTTTRTLKELFGT